MRAMIFIDYKNLISSEYRVDIFKIPQVVQDYLFDYTGLNVNIIKVNVFMGPPINNGQSNFINAMIRHGYDVDCVESSHEHASKGIDVALGCRMVSMSHHNTFDIAVVVSGSADLHPAIREIRNMGKQVLMSCFEDRISNIYKDPTIKTGPTDIEIFYLDNVINAIAMTTIDHEIDIDSIVTEIADEFFGGNMDFDKIKIKKYIAYWATRARFLQFNTTELNDDERDILKRCFDRLNELSNQYKPGYIKSLNKSWAPTSWEDELRRIPKSW